MSRKQRRAAANSAQPTTLEEIPLKQPDRSGPTEPTLYDLAAEREAELWKQIPADKAQKAKEAEAAKAQPLQDGKSEQSEDALLTAIVYGVTLTSVNITLDILTWHQYAQELVYRSLIQRNLSTTLPLSTLLVYIFHAPYFGLTRFEWLRQAIFFCAAVGCGIYAVYLSNEGAFLAVMKRVPPVITMALWAVIEMGPVSSLSSVGLVALAVWWKSWKVF